MRKFGRGLPFGVLVLLATSAHATVTQVNGTIVPVPNGSNDCDGVDNTDDSLQVCFNLAEGVSPPNVNAINAITDASEFPQIFRPRTSSAVVFRDVSEGAGYENSFGWYNIGDDVLSVAGRAANLHPILGCGVPMAATGNATTHQGNPSYYAVNAQPGSMASVDFNAERIAGRYKGGFIGFYLITPEDNPSANNCGDFKNGTDGLSLFGKIYFTQKDLNDDGDFVHHLIYSSKITADRFYFAFEDRFRGGDNDYEDMFIRADGLTPPCVPQAEVCDGLDNDCDGVVDDNPTGIGDACQCDGVGLACSNGPRFGVCRDGVTACVAGAIVCTGTGTASPETCNGLDDNCNNIVDDNPSGTGATCDGSDADLCHEGQIVCQNGLLVCGDNTGPNIELCNNIDDDCDGTIDEGNPGGGGSCGSAIGVCTPGTFQCVGGALVCQGGNQGGPETCNNLDDDCDGVIDDSPTGVGAQCGATNAGVCEFGTTVCVGGTLQCSGQIGPTVEVCNDMDDDCDGIIDDNPVDAGQPCGSSIGACEPGAYACMFGTLVCTGGIGPTMEICNGIDDDCDGVVDDNVPGEGEMCGVGGGTCSNGMTKCIDGSMQCVGGAGNGTEVCNNIDDDCDGEIDEGDLCTGGVCDNGTCAGPCVPGEFPCPTGKKCVADFCVDDPCFNVNCPVDANGNLQTCQEGVCVELCPTIACPTGLVCRGSDGACVPDTCEWLPKCSASELCIASTCQPNPCKDVTCPDGEFCREGACVGSCQGVQCGGGQVCRDGACVASGCPTCATGQVCDPDLGVCVDDQCGGVQCPPLQVCNPVNGSCMPDACIGVTCPNGQTCSMGQCGVSASGSLVTTGGGGGCAAGGGEGSILVALAALGLVLRRRRGVRVLALIAAASLSSAGCEVNDYCLGCDILPDDAGPGGNGDGGSGDDGNNVSCDPMNIRPESCNNADDDCDGLVDETIDFQNDEMNCGACGTQCNKPGAQTKCETGACNILGCFPGFNDENGDITGPYASSDGCEYVCFQSNGGTEACDGLDNDCDGDTDEGFAVQNDVNNCGACGRRCEFFEATPTCSAGTCSFNPATACSPGFRDINMVQADGCEYSCTPSNGGTEACDVRDNDCDGRVDETFNFMTDRFNCGRCGLACAFPNVTPRCVAGMCGYNPATDCLPGFHDIDGQPANGCEYACTPTNGGVERCDGVDNDCDGVADDNPTDAGGPCAATTPATGVCVANGVRTCTAGQLRCVGATQPSVEICDNLDNDCDGPRDENVTRACYTGAANTLGVGRCRAGTETCAVGVFGACMGQITPTTESCNGTDDDCDARIDEGVGGMPITQSCYTGPPGTAGVGICKAGLATCAFGAPGTCVGQVVPRAEVCGDTLDSDCDGLDDTQEGCQITDDEVRLDAGTGVHSYDLVLARGGAPFGGRVYAVWSELVSGQTEVYLRRSVDGGQTWQASINLTSGVTESAVKPQIAVAPGNPDRVVVAYQTVTSGLVRDIRVQVSTDSGQTFGAASAVLDSSGDSFHHSVAVRGQNVVVAWESLDTSTLNRDVMSRTSTDGGATWGTERKINTSTGTRFAGRPQVGITFDAGTSTTRVIYVWREVRGTATRNVYAASVALGALPASNTRLDSDSGDNRDSDFPILVVNETAAYVTWQDVSTVAGAGSDVMFVRTTNQGTAWSAERIIDDPSNEVSSSFTPSIAVDPRAAGVADDVVAIAWEDRRQGTQIYAARSLDGGATFGAAVRASNETGDPIAGETTVPQIAASGSGVLTVVYQNKLPMAARSHVFIATSIDNGATWTHTHEQLDAGTGNAIFPQVVASVVGASNQAAAVAGWTDFRADGINGSIYTAVSR